MGKTYSLSELLEGTGVKYYAVLWRIVGYYRSIGISFPRHKKGQRYSGEAYRMLKNFPELYQEKEQKCWEQKGYTPVLRALYEQFDVQLSTQELHQKYKIIPHRIKKRYFQLGRCFWRKGHQSIIYMREVDVQQLIWLFPSITGGRKSLGMYTVVELAKKLDYTWQYISQYIRKLEEVGYRLPMAWVGRKRYYRPEALELLIELKRLPAGMRIRKKIRVLNERRE